MVWLSSDELIQLMAERPLEEVVETHIFGGEAYVFRDAPGDYQLLRDDLSSSLSIASANLTIVGSAKTGFSMAPETFGTPFRDDSDVDVVVVDADRFDQLWFTLLSWDKNVTPNGNFVKNWKLRRREDVYWGRFFTGEPLNNIGGKYLRRFRDISNQWFAAFQSVGLRHTSLASRKFNGRLYRTWDHAQVYHIASLRKCYSLNQEESAT